jgi:IS4 transposase
MEKSIGMEEIKKILPKEWEEKAYELEAMGRSGEVKTAEDLLRLNMLYVTSGCSIGGTSTILKAGGAMKLNKNAVAERLEKSEKWLKWLSVNAGLVSRRPDWLEYRRVLAVDATREACPDAEKTVWNLHYMLDIFSLEAAEIKLTDEKCGEKLENYETVSRGDIIIGDRAYGTLKSIEYAYNRMADYVFRLKADAFNLYDGTGKLVDMKKKIRRMRESAYKEFDLHYKYSGELKPLRICVYRKDATEIKEVSDKTSDKQKFYHDYVIVGTSLTESAAQILELYRLRWQIELLFKRLKSIFNLDELKAKKEESVRVWFYCKLLLAAICEALDNMGRFSPDSQFSFVPSQQVQ